MNPPFETAPDLAAFAGIKHGFFGRQSGSAGELNMSESFGIPEAVAANYNSALGAISAPNVKLVRLTQTHSNRVVTLTAETDLSRRPDADGLVTAQSGIALTILTADCTPLLFADENAGIIGACHAGWKGAVSGVIGNTISAMVTLGANPANITAAIGPTISGPNYEVGPQFAANLLASEPDAAPFFYVPQGKSREHFDLPAYSAHQVTRAGLNPPAFVGGCTFAWADRYFSHRHATAGLSAPGRQAALITMSE